MPPLLTSHKMGPRRSHATIIAPHILTYVPSSPDTVTIIAHYARSALPLPRYVVRPTASPPCPACFPLPTCAVATGCSMSHQPSHRQRPCRHWCTGHGDHPGARRAHRTGLGQPSRVGYWARPRHGALGQLPARHCLVFSIFLNFILI
jgi:hypothetical protein